MIRLIPISVGMLLAWSPMAEACEPPPVFYAPFSTERAANADITSFISQNAPVVRDVSLGRGSAAQESLCGGQGYVSFTIALPPGAPVTFADLGLELRVIDGSFPRYALPEGPISSTLGAREDFQHLGSWFEGPPARHKTISAEIEARFVAPDGTRGKGARFTLFSEPEKPKTAEEQTR
ncbi:hypothetical protein EI983_07420 [Roseovarius faecimaris]|uniref:Uncharacterized protein n=1 Tax=Roseovarius faecimaris TaxID=2494550 RepID=A0A6I6IRC3_9RHOB|nr:hypothetical protein [Roseovarius faecimaris]QGX98117.1 hypothetical protein EI983_07420 [Roseovarius faecimaris]